VIDWYVYILGRVGVTIVFLGIGVGGAYKIFAGAYKRFPALGSSLFLSWDFIVGF